MTPPHDHMSSGPRADGSAARTRIEPCEGWVRAVFCGETVAESEDALVLHETGYPPRLYFPMKDVRLEVLEPTQRVTHCPHKGDAVYWTVRIRDRSAENAVWAYPDALPEVDAIRGHVSFTDAIEIER